MYVHPMLTGNTLLRLSRIEKQYKQKPPSTTALLSLARKYGEAAAKWGIIYDAVDKVRGLDEFHPKHMAWEKSLFRAECKKDVAREFLLLAARYVK
jgi:hypothetical protein